MSSIFNVFALLNSIASNDISGALNSTASIAKNYQFGFITPASPIAEGIICFHDDLMIFLTLILGFVIYILSACLSRFTNANGETERLVHASAIEIVWTIIPALILITIAIPSFSLIYSIDEIVEPLFTVKVVGHQWYWSYEFLDPEVVATIYNEQLSSQNLAFEAQGSASFDSYMLSDDELYSKEAVSSHRLLTVDNHLFVPTQMNVRAMITSSDVIHSWAIPSLGIKLDACPGRLNQTSMFIKREGLYYGQCSELCGVNHAFMPIGIASYEMWSTAETTVYDFEPILSTLQAAVLE